MLSRSGRRSCTDHGRQRLNGFRVDVETRASHGKVPAESSRGAAVRFSAEAHCLQISSQDSHNLASRAVPAAMEQRRPEKTGERTPHTGQVQSSGVLLNA